MKKSRLLSISPNQICEFGCTQSLKDTAIIIITGNTVALETYCQYYENGNLFTNDWEIDTMIVASSSKKWL